MGLFDRNKNHQWRTQQQHQPVMASGVGFAVGSGIGDVVAAGVEDVAAAGADADVVTRMETRPGSQ